MEKQYTETQTVEIEVIRLRDGGWAPLALFRTIVRMLRAGIPSETFGMLTAGEDRQTVHRCLDTIIVDATLPEELLELAAFYMSPGETPGETLLAILDPRPEDHFC